MIYDINNITYDFANKYWIMFPSTNRIFNTLPRAVAVPISKWTRQQMISTHRKKYGTTHVIDEMEKRVREQIGDDDEEWELVYYDDEEWEYLHDYNDFADSDWYESLMAKKVY